MYYFYDRRLGWDLEGQYIALVADVMVGFKELLLVHTQPGDGVIINPPAYPPYFKDIPHVGRRVVEVPLLDGLRRRRGRAGPRVRRGREGAAAVLAAQPERARLHAGRARGGGGRRRGARRARGRGRDPRAADVRRRRSRRGSTCWKAAPCSPRPRRRSTCPGSSSGSWSARRRPRWTRTCATTRATRAWSRRRRRSPTATSGWTRRSRRSPPTSGRCRRCCPRACGSRTRRRRPTSRGSSATSTIRRARSSSAGAWRSTTGTEFGAAYGRYARLNVGTRPELVREAVRRMAQALD